MNKLFLILLSLVFVSGLSAQVFLDNPSFEGEAEDATMPNGWLECKKGTTPDILPGYWGVYNEPSDGETYIGLITRSDKTWESIGQRLSEPLKIATCYQMSLDLAHSKTYTGYNKPIRLRVWGSKTRCSRDQLLWKSEIIEHSDWETYELEFRTNGTFNYIIFEAYYPGNHNKPLKGNVLLDNVSEIDICERA